MIGKTRTISILLGLAAFVFAASVSPTGAQGVSSAPAPVTGVMVTAEAKGPHDAIKVSWVNPSGNNQSAFRIQCSTDRGFAMGVKTISAPGTAASRIIHKLRKSTMYYVRVQAYNASGASPFTNATLFPITTP